MTPNVRKQFIKRLQKRFIELAKQVKARRPYHDDKPFGYLESDDDFYENNQTVAIELLHLALEVREV